MASRSSSPPPPATPPPMHRGDSQLRDSVRKIRKRVVSVIRRGSKTGKSRSASQDPAERVPSTTPHDTDHEDEPKHPDDDKHHAEHHDDDSGDEDHSQHSGRSRASSTHSMRHAISSVFGSRSGSRAGSRSASPQPPMTPSQINGHLAPSSPTANRLSFAGFPRSPTRKNKAKGGETPDASVPPVRARTVSTPAGSPPKLAHSTSEPGKLTVPIPKRERALSNPAHPLAASPIQAASPPAVQGMVFTFATAMEHQDAPREPSGISEVLDEAKTPTAASSGNALLGSPPAGLVESPETEIKTPPLAEVVAAPAPDVFTTPTPKIEIEPETPQDVVGLTEQTREERPTTPSTGLTREASIGSTRDSVSSHTKESSIGHAKETSGHTREPAGREPSAGSGLSRPGSMIGSELGWSILEPTQEEEEPEEEGKRLGPEIKIEEVPVSLDEVAVKAEEVPVKLEEGVVKTEDAPRKVDDSVQTDDEVEGEKRTGSGVRTPLAAEEEEELMNGVFAMSPEGTGCTPTRAPSSDMAYSGVFIDTPPRETHPTWISSVPTPPRSVTPPRPTINVSTPMTPPAQTGPTFNPSAFSTPGNQTDITQDSPETPSPSRFSGTYTPYTGDQTPPPAPAMSDSYFHPRNVERLNPRHFERSMSTMGVYGDAEPDGTSVRERLGGAPRPSIDTMLAPDMSIHEMISPSVRAANGDGPKDGTELRELAGTELRDWYEGEGRTPKTVRMMLPEDGETPPANGNGSGAPRRSALSQSHTPLQPPISLRSQSQEVQPSERAQTYSSVLSRLISHMDRRSTLMTRLATRLGALGGALVERHPREWTAQSLPSGKVYYAHRLVVEGSSQPGQTPNSADSNQVAKVLVIPTPSAPQPVTLVTDLDMADNATHAGVNAFVDKCLQERDTDLPSGWEVWVHASSQGDALDWDESSSEGSVAGGTGAGEEVDLGYGAPLVLVWTYVSHKRRRVGSQGPEEKFVQGEDAEFDLEMERRYWAYVETHPAHADVNPRAVQEAIELLTWHYTDRLLAEKKRGEKEAIQVKPPFTPEESHEVLEFLKSLSQEYSHANAILKARTVARVHVRTAEWRLAKLHAVSDAVNLEVMSPSERIRRRRAAANPFVGVPLRTLASLLGLGIPYLFVEQPDEKVEDRQRMMVADASTNLMSALMLGASVSFLAIPDLEDIARLAGVAAAACSLGSLAAGIIRLRIPFSRPRPNEELREDEPQPSALRTFARSLPLVLSAYAGSALVAGLAAYSWRGQVSSVDDPFTRLYLDDSWRSHPAGGRWFGSLMRRDSGSGHVSGGLGSESSRPGWSEASSQGLIRLWGTW